MICKMCGSEITDEAIGCVYCESQALEDEEVKNVEEMNPIEETKEDAVEESSEKPKKKKKKTVISIVSIVVAILLVVGSVFAVLFFIEQSKKQAFADMLTGKAFQYVYEYHYDLDNIKSEDFDDLEDTSIMHYSIERITFLENNQCRVEYYSNISGGTPFDYTTKYEIELCDDTDTLFLVYCGTSAQDQYEVELTDSGTPIRLVDITSTKEDIFEEIDVDEAGSVSDLITEKNKEIKKLRNNARFNAITKEQAEEKQAAIDKVENLKYRGYTIANLVNTIFKPGYTVECEKNSDGSFIVKVSGAYYPNKVSMPSITHKGSIAIKVSLNADEENGTIESGNAIFTAFDTYLALGTNWYN